MKKLLLVLAVILMVIFSSVAYAKTSPEFYNINDPAHIGLGGLTSGFNYEQVCNIHGEPTKVHRTKNPKTDVLFPEPYYDVYAYYGKTVKLSFIMLSKSKEMRLYKIESTGKNGWKTPDGLTVGMKESEMKKILGPSFQSADKPELHSYNSEVGSLIFTVKDGVITRIVCIVELA
jgi:hypothetical protein